MLCAQVRCYLGVTEIIIMVGYDHVFAHFKLASSWQCWHPLVITDEAHDALCKTLDARRVLPSVGNLLDALST